MPRKKDDSNKFVVSITAFNRTALDPLAFASLLAVGALVGHLIYHQIRRAIR
jgi:hypothetical protein